MVLRIGRAGLALMMREVHRVGGECVGNKVKVQVKGGVVTVLLGLSLVRVPEASHVRRQSLDRREGRVEKGIIGYRSTHLCPFA
jgi:hypothetical protein